ncbi:hypothetical protein VTK56DRAFT_4569 [Thermocarpiscus australiensis]
MMTNVAPHLEMDGFGIDHRFHLQHHHQHSPFATQQQQSLQTPRKRRAEEPPENNERLSKRMSLLNLEHSGQKLYVPVENTNSQSTYTNGASAKNSSRRKHTPDDSLMHLDDSKHKVYIYDLDAELSSDSEADASDGDGGRLIFLPDIEKHLRANRLPPHVPYRPDPTAELAGKELVLYSVPSSLSVPEEQDNVRKAIIEARARARERQLAERACAASPSPAPAVTAEGIVSMDTEVNGTNGFADASNGPPSGEDPDAMELD